jgi:hypothetical protein
MLIDSLLDVVRKEAQGAKVTLVLLGLLLVMKILLKVLLQVT